MRACTGCGRRKPEDEFNLNGRKANGGREARCRACKAKYYREYRNRPGAREARAAYNAKRYSDPEVRRRQSESNRRRETTHAARLDAMKLAAGCVRCGFNASAQALHFHHRGEKNFSIGSGKSRSWEALLAETRLCDVLCANCHAILHAEERGQRDPSDTV